MARRATLLSVAAVATILVAGCSGSASTAQPKTTSPDGGASVERVVDGDTLVVRVSGRRDRVRLMIAFAGATCGGAGGRGGARATRGRRTRRWPRRWRHHPPHPAGSGLRRTRGQSRRRRQPRETPTALAARTTAKRSWPGRKR